MDETVEKKNVVTEGTIWLLTLITAIPFLLLFKSGVSEFGLLQTLLIMSAIIAFAAFFSRMVQKIVISYCSKRGIELSNEPRAIVMNYSGSVYPTLIIKLARFISTVGLSVLVAMLCVWADSDYKILTVVSSFLFFSAIQGRDITRSKSIRNGALK